MTSQLEIASDIGLTVAVDLANLVRSRHGVPELRALFAADPVSVESIDDSDAAEFLELAKHAADIAELLVAGTGSEVDRAAERVNQLLERFPAQLHLTKQDEGWTLHRHRRDLPLVAAWSAVVAAAFARLIGEGRESRLGACGAAHCTDIFYDLSKNSSRRFCSLACQNRTKTAAYRSRKAS